MGSTKPKVYQTPFKSDTQQTNTYDRFSVADSPEGQSFLNAPLDFGDETNVDPGVGRRTALAEQEAENEANSALSFGVPGFVRRANLAKTRRDIQGQGAYEAQQAEYLNQQGNNQRRGMVTQANLGRLERLLPQILQTGGTSNTSGFNSQVVQPQPGFWQRLALGVAQGAAGGLKIPGLGG